MHICNNFIFIFNMKENHGVKIDHLKLMKTLSQLVLRLGKIQYGKKLDKRDTIIGVTLNLDR